MAATLIEWADEQERLAKEAPPNAAQRVLAALERSPSYAGRYPAYAGCLQVHAMTVSQITRALGSSPNVRAVVHAGIQQLLAAGTIEQVQSPVQTPGTKPEMYVLSSFAHHLKQPAPANSTPDQNNADPFAHEWTPPWSRT